MKGLRGKRIFTAGKLERLRVDMKQKSLKKKILEGDRR